MIKHLMTSALALSVLVGAGASTTVLADDGWKRDWNDKRGHQRHWGNPKAQLGPRPFFLVDNMDDSRLKQTLKQCENGPFYRTDFSIGHRGAPLQFPEHTVESYLAASRMGAGILECDVTFTKDRELVCRHSQCDLHTTTNILLDDELAQKCSEPFTPADPTTGKPASAKCCTSDITLAEFRTLKGKMDAADRSATTVEEYVGGTADWRTDLYAGTDEANSLGTLMTHRESIRLFRDLGVKMTPELKSPSVEMPFQGNYTQEDYAQQMIDEYKQERIPPRQVYPQSFNRDDVLYWIENEPAYGNQAVYLDDSYSTLPADEFEALMDSRRKLRKYMRTLVDQGIQIVAPPMWMLVTTNDNGRVKPSKYAKAARRAGLDIITWTFERSNLTDGGGDWYHQTTEGAVEKPGDRYKTLDVLAKKVGVLGVFTDWPASVTYYANCMGLR